MKRIILMITSVALFTGCATKSDELISEENDQYKVVFGEPKIAYQEQFHQEGKVSYKLGYSDGCKNSKKIKDLEKPLLYNSNYYYNLGYDDGYTTCKGGSIARNYSK